ncbi:MAG TPA: FAD-dependent oxidoreductase [Candidatus Methanomethylophilaceae archaeon]|nr:FAD-dependent oxidoreductase [Candidatus Methanomethylophilaceae archaeon]
MAKKIIIIGSGAAGMTAASSARKFDSGSEITLITEDEDVAYSPCAIPWVLEGKNSWDRIVMHVPEYYSKEKNITIHTRTKVDSVDAEAKEVLANGKKYKYDSLVIATGGKVFIPPINGIDLEGVFTLRTIRDGKNIEACMKKTDKVVIAGAGVIGLEMAVALRNVGKDVTIIEMMDQVIPRIADGDMAAPIQKHLEDLGITVVLKAPVEEVLGDKTVKAIKAAGKEYPCGMVIFATGVRANLDIPKELGFDIGQLGAVLVSPTLQPYKRGRLVNDIYLAGDLIQSHSAAVPGPTMSQLGSSAVREGAIAGRNAAGDKAVLGPTASPWVSVIGDFQIAGTGMSRGLASWYGISIVEGVAEGLTRARYSPGGKKLIVKITAEKSSHRIIGAQIFAGEDANGRINWLSTAVMSGITAEDFLAMSENAYCPPTSMVKDVVLSAAEDLVRNLSS